MHKETRFANPPEILVVDDHADNLRLLSRILEIHGYGVVPAIDGSQAIAMANAAPPNLILLDIKMPQMDGFEVCRRLKADSSLRDIPVLFISALYETENRVEGFAAGGVDYITKPFEPEEVLARVRTHLRLRELNLRLEQRVEERTVELREEVAERKRAESALRQLNRKQRAVDQCNQVLLRAEDEQSLLDAVCRIICEQAGYPLAWVGFAEDDAEKTVRPVAWAGPKSAYVDTLDLTWSEEREAGRGPAGLAIRSGETVVVQDIVAEPCMGPWREAQLAHGFRGTFVLPLRLGAGQVFGALFVYNSQANNITQDELHLLEGLAANLAYGITALRERAARQAAERQVSLLSSALDGVQEAAYLVAMDARLRYVNDAACRVLGYSRNELLKMQVFDINPDLLPESWDEEIVERKSSPKTFETRHRRKDGRIFPVEISSSPLEFEEEEFFLALVRDISARKQLEQVTGARLRMLEIAQTAGSLEEALQGMLDQVEKLTGSIIGFYHFFDEDQQTLSLQSWSTNTSQNMCAVEGLGTHYPPEQAGVWVDCVRQRRPVIHNDYHSLPLRHGMPEGHAEVVRELVVPVFRDEKIVAVIGVGNKPTEYDQTDVEIVVQLGDFSWEIAERKRAEEKLRESEARMRLTLETAQVGIFDWDLVADRWQASPTYYSMLGYEPQIGLGNRQEWLALVHPDDRERVEKLIGGMLATRQIRYSYEARLRHADGSYRWQQVQGFGFDCDADGCATRILGIRTDIHERKRAEEQLRSHQQLFSALVEKASNLAILRYDSQLRRTYINPITQRLFGVPEEELIGRLPTTGPSPLAEPELYMARLRQSLETGEECELETTFRNSKGETRWCHLRFVPEFDASGAVHSILAIGFDIHELKTNELRFRALAESLPDNIVRYDRNAKTVYVNPVLERTLGDVAANMVGINVREIFPDGRYEVYAEAVDRALATGENNEFEFVVPEPGEEPIVHQIRLIVERDVQGAINGVLAIGRDITEQKRVERERHANLRFFESMERINRAIQAAEDIEQMMSDVLDVTLEIFSCDRAYLLYPCDPAAESWGIPMESTRPEYPGLMAEIGRIFQSTGMAKKICTLLASEGPVAFGPGAENPVPAEVANRYGFKSLLAMAAYPKLDKPWEFGIHQCSHVRSWTADEQRLFEAIGRRLADALSSLLLSRDLRDSETRYRTIVETAKEGVWMLDAEGVTTFVNNRILEMFGYPREEMLARTASDFLFAEDIPDHLEKLAERCGGIAEHYERRMRHRDGSPVWTSVSATPIFDEECNYRGSIVMFTDISQQKLTEEKLRAERERLAAMTAELSLAEERERLRIASVLHDHIGQLLLLGQIKLDDLTETGKMPDNTRETVREVRDLLDRTARDVHSLTLQLNPPILDVAGLEAALQWLGRQMENDYGLQVEFHGDRGRKKLGKELETIIYQCARELLINVAKHAGTESAQLTVAHARDGFCLSVADRGKGFDPAAIRSGQSENWRFGLFSVQTRIERLGGEVSIVSAAGEGCRIEIHLPISQQDQHTEGEHEQ